MNKKQLDFLKRYNIEIEDKPFGELAIKALKNFSCDLECLSTLYTRASDQYHWRCLICGHEWKANWNNIMKGRGCPRCKKKTVFLSDLEKEAHKRGGKLLSKKYINCDTKYYWECSRGHKWAATWDTVKQGCWCIYCANRVPPAKEEIEKLISNKGGSLVDFYYKNNRSKLTVKCRNSHEFYISWHDLRSGNWCRKCSRQGTSKKEEEIIEYFEGFNVLKNYKPSFMDNKKELDLYFPDFSLAVEHHGLIWHSEAFVKDRKKLKLNHKDKLLKCLENGIQLIQVFGDEWENSKSIVLSCINHKLGNTKVKIPARKTEIKELSNSEQLKFFKENHIAGGVKSNKSWGLFYEHKLVAAISFRKPFTKKYINTIEIARFATALNISVVGALSRLLKTAEDHFSNYSQILTYADRRWGEGLGYEKIGFIRIGETEPNYFYVNNSGIREGRFKHRKNNNPEFMVKYGHTEREQNRNLKWYRIYDAGSNIYVKKLTKSKVY